MPEPALALQNTSPSTDRRDVFGSAGWYLIPPGIAESHVPPDLRLCDEREDAPKAARPDAE